MKKIILSWLFLTLLTATTACAQVCFITCIVKDVTNATYQALKLTELQAILRQAGEQTKIAQEVRDAAKRAQRQYHSFANEADRAIAVDNAQTRIIGQVVNRLRASGAISYHMDAREWSNTFAMGRPTDDPDYDIRMNERSMETVTATMSTLQGIAAQTEQTAVQLDLLAERLDRAATLEERQAIESSIILLRSRHKTLRDILKLSLTNLDGTLDAVQLDAGVNAVTKYRQDQEAIHKLAKSLTQ